MSNRNLKEQYFDSHETLSESNKEDLVEEWFPSKSRKECHLDNILLDDNDKDYHS
jgi:hypothetical protein